MWGEGRVRGLWSGQHLRLARCLTLPGASLLLAVPVLRDPDPLAHRHPLVPPLHLVHLVNVDLRRAWRHGVTRGGVVVGGWKASWREEMVVSRVVIVSSSTSTTTTTMTSGLPRRHGLRLDLEVAWACSWRRCCARD